MNFSVFAMMKDSPDSSQKMVSGLFSAFLTNLDHLVSRQKEV